jgi:hypothetical protein
LASFHFWSGNDQSKNRHGNNKSEDDPNFHKRAIIPALGATVKNDRCNRRAPKNRTTNKLSAVCDLCD